jgi:3-deoxy-D-manno-octulosonic-acid transferase
VAVLLSLIFNRRARPGFLNRLGIIPFISDLKGKILIHSSSLGEFNGVRPFIDLLKQKRHSCSLSAFTDTGYAAIKKYQADGPRFIMPLDGILFLLPLILNRPSCIIITETELWPNLIMMSRLAGIPLHLINGRITALKLKNYLALRAFYNLLLGCFTGIFLQDNHSSRLFERLVPRHRWPVAGSTKIDGIQNPGSQSSKSRRLVKLLHLAGRKVITGGSVRRNEHKILLSAYQNILKKKTGLKNQVVPVLTLAPRHLDRIPDLVSDVRDTGLSWALYSKTDGKPKNIIIIDKMGILMDLYAVSDIVFVGGTLAGTGGHNPIEPALTGCAILHGPSTDNNSFAFELLKEKGASIQVSPESLPVILNDLINNDKKLKSLKNKARNAVQSAKGVSRRLYAYLFPAS